MTWPLSAGPFCSPLNFSRTETELEPSLSVKTVLKHKQPFPERNGRNRKPEPFEPSHPRTVTEPNPASLSNAEQSGGHKRDCLQTRVFPPFQEQGVLTTMAKMTNVPSVHKGKSLLPQAPENNTNEENGENGKKIQNSLDWRPIPKNQI